MVTKAKGRKRSILCPHCKKKSLMFIPTGKGTRYLVLDCPKCGSTFRLMVLSGDVF